VFASAVAAFWFEVHYADFAGLFVLDEAFAHMFDIKSTEQDVVHMRIRPDKSEMLFRSGQFDVL